MDAGRLSAAWIALLGVIADNIINIGRAMEKRTDQ
jgi:hypothetical protein